MTRWPSLLFGVGLILLGCLAFFDIFGFDAMGPYLRGSSHSHLPMITGWGAAPLGRAGGLGAG